MVRPCLRTAYVRSNSECRIVQQTPFLHISQIYKKKRKSDANKQGFKMKIISTWKI